MKERTRTITIASISGAVGGALGAVCGSTNWIVVACVSGVTAALIAFGINGTIR